MPQSTPQAPDQGPVHFSTANYGCAEQAFQRYCELTADMCDISMIGHVSDFEVTTTTWHLAGALLLENRSSTLRYDRTPSHVARGIDHFQVAVYLSGGAQFAVTDQVLEQRPGDVSIIDMGQPSQTRELPGEDGSTKVLTFMLPRMLLTPSLSKANPFGAVTVLPREVPYGRMLGDYILALRGCVAELTYAQSQAAVQALVQLVVGSAGYMADGATVIVKRSRGTLPVEIKRYIEQELGSDALDVNRLCARFGLSRANLYRMFGAIAPATYIQQRRLQRAFAMLISPAFRSWRILDVALACQFSSDATFIRAFRRTFGLTPGEARNLSTSIILGAPPGDRTRGLPGPDAEAVRWVQQLTGAAPHLRPEA
ncbi:AraC family transcriptional regulator [Ralstonia solanacearum]